MVGISKKREELPQIIREVIHTYQDSQSRFHHLGDTPLPNEQNVTEILNRLRTVLFPGYFGREYVNPTSVEFYIGELLYEIYELLGREIFKALANFGAERCQEKAEDTCLQFLRRVPELRKRLALDVEAAMEGDPAAKSYDEIIFSYPGLSAITVYRIAHELYDLGVPLLPRIMTEHAHRQTGIDIHPGARIGPWFFIDHGTGVVIGETTEIGERVKIYQGVTLGALSFKEGAEGMRNKKRHPTIQDNVVIYAGATILGGDTVIGRDSVIGGNVWIINSLPPRSKVMMEVPRLKIQMND